MSNRIWSYLARLKPKSLLAQYAVTVASVTFALLVRLALIPYTGTGAPFLFFFAAVLFASLLGGRGPGLLAAILGAPAGAYFFVVRAGYPPSQAVFQASLFLLESIVVTELARAVENSRSIAERSAEIARRAVRLRDDLLSMVAHDLKNPLSSIGMRAELILDKSDSEITQHAKGIVSSTKLMEKLINDLLDLAKMESGNLELNLKECSLSKLLSDLRGQLEPLARKKSIHLNIEPTSVDDTLICEEMRIFQVLINLIGNALKFTPDGGLVKVRVTNTLGAIQFEVEDSGPGIPDGQIPFLFDRYYQAREHNPFGSGLGLAIAKGIVGAHGGKIWVSSKLGHGSTFYFILPTRPPRSELIGRERENVRWQILG